jgi:hypothetical protein
MAIDVETAWAYSWEYVPLQALQREHPTRGTETPHRATRENQNPKKSITKNKTINIREKGRQTTCEKRQLGANRATARAATNSLLQQQKSRRNNKRVDATTHLRFSRTERKRRTRVGARGLGFKDPRPICLLAWTGLMVFMWSLFSPLIITRPNGGVLDLNLGTQVPRPIIYKTILPNLHDHFAKSTWPVCKSHGHYINLHSILQNPHNHYVNLHGHSAKIHITIMWIYMTILPNPHEHSAKSIWHYVNLHDHSAKSRLLFM